MQVTPRCAIACTITALLLGPAPGGVALAAPGSPLTPSPGAHYPPGSHYKPLCPTPDERGRKCHGQILVDANDEPIAEMTSPPGGWTPNELEAAYGLPASGGYGTTIAMYIGNHYTNAESDVATYRSKFGMTPCTSATGCFTQITDSGGTDFSGLKDDGCSGWIGEESLDIDMLMAGCPHCKILVLEGSDHAAALKTASARGAVSVSMSWTYSPSSESDCASAWVPPPGLALFGASGDTGYTASPGEPATCAGVVAVGWTQLATASTPRGYADTLPSGWGSAGGCSGKIPKPSWEADPSCSSRLVSDISANGDNVAAYCTSPNGSTNWHVTGGSSAASPFTSGVLATLGVTGGSFAPSWLYANRNKFWDVTTGGPVQNCPSGSPAYFCSAVPGYDGPTGVGTPYGPGLIGGDAGAGATCAMPVGSFSQSCTGCAAGGTAAGCLLACASCTRIDASENASPTLALPCAGMVVNDNGVLECLAAVLDAGGGDAGRGTDAASAEDATTETDGTAGSSDGAGEAASSGLDAPSTGLSSEGGEDAAPGSGAAPSDAGHSAWSRPAGTAGCSCNEDPVVASTSPGVPGCGVFLFWLWRRRTGKPRIGSPARPRSSE